MSPDSSDAVLTRYRELAAEHFDMKVKGKANPYTSMNGNMFSFFDKTGFVCLRLSKEDRAAFVQRFDTEPVVQYGAVMKEYVTVPGHVLDDPAEARGYFRKCLAYAKSLPAKATKR